MPIGLRKKWRGKTVSYHKKVLAIKWMDEKEIKMLSTIHKGTMMKETIRNKEVSKPDCVFDYKVTMGGVDKSDQCMDSYTIVRKRQKNTMKKYFIIC